MNLVEAFVKNNPCFQANANRQDSRYITFQERGPLGGMLHSVGCAQPSAKVFVNNFNLPSCDDKCVHGFIDANNGTVYQTLPWYYRGWHAGKAAGNNTLLGIEMCESSHIKYRKDDLTKFDILNKEKAQADCKRAYESAVELFAMLAIKYKWDPEKDILSHFEGGLRGMATGHKDPEHYWSGLGMSYTMDGFRKDVKKIVDGTYPGFVNGEPVSNPDDKLYRIMVGAFRNYNYASQYLAEVQKTFPNAYITTK